MLDSHIARLFSNEAVCIVAKLLAYVHRRLIRSTLSRTRATHSNKNDVDMRWLAMAALPHSTSYTFRVVISVLRVSKLGRGISEDYRKPENRVSNSTGVSTVVGTAKPVQEYRQ